MGLEPPQIDLFWVVPERHHRPRSPQEGPFPGWVPVLNRKKTQMGLQGGLRKSGYFLIPTLMLNLKVKIAADGTKMVFYLTNVTNAVNLSQPSARIGGGLHAPIHISQQSVGLDRSIFQRLDNGIPTRCKVRSRVRRAARSAQSKLPYCQEW